MLWAFGWAPDFECLSNSGGPPFSTANLVVVLGGTRWITWEFVYTWVLFLSFFLLFIGVVADLLLISELFVVFFRMVAWISFSFINIYILPLKKI